MLRILLIRVPAMKLGSHFVSTTRWVRSPAAFRSVTRTGLPESPKIAAPSHANASVRQVNATPARGGSARANHQAVTLVSDRLGAGSVVTAARPRSGLSPSKRPRRAGRVTYRECGVSGAAPAATVVR